MCGSLMSDQISVIGRVKLSLRVSSLLHVSTLDQLIRVRRYFNIYLIQSSSPSLSFDSFARESLWDPIFLFVYIW